MLIIYMKFDGLFGIEGSDLRDEFVVLIFRSGDEYEKFVVSCDIL